MENDVMARLEESGEEYPNGIRIQEWHDIHVPFGASDSEDTDSGPYYRVFPPQATGMPQFDDIDMARLWVDVYFAVGGFTEDDTGDRGVPPEVAAAGRELLMAYLMTQDHTDVDSLASFFDVSKNTVYSYLSRARSRGEEARAKYD